MKNLELLSPAGSMESLKAAVQAGCDAVYLGGKSFSARQGASNFGDDELRAAIEYCHLRGVKAYVAVNTLYKEEELPSVYAFLAYAYEVGADAFIVQDLGLASFIKKHFEIKLHASTQMTTHSKDDVAFLEAFGFDRVVLSRELSLDEIKDIAALSQCELEVFVHGALCVSYSGRCLFSSMLGGRSGNRGRCAQPCRLKYALVKDDDRFEIDSGYLLSPKDMQGLPVLKELEGCNAWISVKIEGRMKSPEYVFAVTKAYRTAIREMDKHQDGQSDSIGKSDNQQTLKELTQVFNRGGSFNNAYFHEFSGLNMMSPKTPKSTGVFLGRVTEYSAKSGKTVILAEEDVVAGDGIEIWTRQEPHVGTGLNKPVKKGESLFVTLFGDIRPGDLVYKSYDKALTDRLQHDLQEDTRKQVIQGKLLAKVSKPLRLELHYKGHKLITEGSIVEEAKNKPMSPERLLEQVNKTGNTPFRFQLEAEIDENIFIGISEMNALRRNASDRLGELILADSKRDPVPLTIVKDLAQANTDTKNQANADTKNNQAKPDAKTHQAKLATQNHHERELSIQVLEAEQAAFLLKPEAARLERVKRIYIPLVDEALRKRCKELGIEYWVTLPSVDRGSQESKQLIARTKDVADGYLARNLGQLASLKKLGLRATSDYTLHAFNTGTVEALSEYAELVTVSPELSFAGLSEMNGGIELLAHGHLTLMTTHQCPVGLYAGKKKSGKYCKLRNNAKGYCLKDRKDLTLPILTDCSACVAYILNGSTLCLLNRISETKDLPIQSLRLCFTLEFPYEVMKVVEAYDLALKDYSNGSLEIDRATYGRYFRDIE